MLLWLPHMLMSVGPCGLSDAQIDNGRGRLLRTCVVVWTVVQCGCEILWKAREPGSLRPVPKISGCIINQGRGYMTLSGWEGTPAGMRYPLNWGLPII